jgi:hypothetical protein
MGEHSKEYKDFESMLLATQAMAKFQSIHNIIRKDYLELLRITADHQANEIEFDALYRASLTRLFSLIEADIYGLNLLDPFEGYNDKKIIFIERFKATYKQICKTWKKENLQKVYFDTKLQALKDLKKKRDELIHPKEMEHIHKGTTKDFQALQGVFNDYDKFINDLMNDFFVSTKIPLSF